MEVFVTDATRQFLNTPVIWFSVDDCMCGIICCLGHNIWFVTTLVLFDCVMAMAVDLTWDQEFEFSVLLIYSSGTFLYIIRALQMRMCTWCGRKKRWCCGESSHLSQMWPRFKSRRQSYMWVEFVVGSLPCPKRFVTVYSGFPLS